MRSPGFSGSFISTYVRFPVRPPTRAQTVCRSTLMVSDVKEYMGGFGVGDKFFAPENCTTGKGLSFGFHPIPHFVGTSPVKGEEGNVLLAQQVKGISFLPSPLTGEVPKRSAGEGGNWRLALLVKS